MQPELSLYFFKALFYPLTIFCRIGKRFALLIVFSILTHFAYSQYQQNFQQGYLINFNNDTLRGFVDYRNWESNPKTIRFKLDADGLVTNHTPMDTKEFGVADECYSGAIVKTEISPFKTNDLSRFVEVQFKNDTVFLQNIINGPKSLYFNSNSYGRESFYIRRGESFELLVYKRYLMIKNGIRLIKEDKTFKSQLSTYFDDCGNFLYELMETEYTKKSLQRLFRAYYKCSSTEMKFEKYVEKNVAKIGCIGGISNTAMDFSGEVFEYLTMVDYSQSWNPSAGIFFNVVLPRNQAEWSIVNELFYTSFAINGRYEERKSENNFTVTTSEFGYSYLKFNSLFRFSYPVKTINLFLNTGFSLGFVLSENNHLTEVKTFYSLVKTREGKALQNTRDFEQSFLLGLGTSYQKFSFEIRHEKGVGVSKSMFISSPSTRYHFLIGYRF